MKRLPAAPLRPPAESSPHCVSSHWKRIEGGAGWEKQRRSWISEPLYIALTEGPPFPEAPIQARAAASAPRGNLHFSKSLICEGGTESKNMSYQGKKNIPKITVSREELFIRCGNFDAVLLGGGGNKKWIRVTALLCAMDQKHALRRAGAFPSPLSALAAGSRWGKKKNAAQWNGTSGCHRDGRSGRRGVFLKVSCIFFVERIHARRGAGSPWKASLKRSCRDVMQLSHQGLHCALAACAYYM